MAEFFHMSGYAVFVWGSYAAFAVILLADALAPSLAKRQLAQQLRARWARQQRSQETPS